MKDKKLVTINNLFEGKEIRSIWDSEKEEYYFSVVDVVGVLSDSNIPRNYWSDLKRKLKKEGSEIIESCILFKLKSSDGKSYFTDTLDMKGILRLIESIPSRKAEPFKLWLAQLGKERIDEIYDPEKAVSRAITYYQRKGYSNKWIEERLTSIIDRNRLTNVWQENGIKNNYEYAILTDEIYREWSGMKSSEYKKFKNIKKESLRDNMTDIEVALVNLSEVATKELAKKKKPYGLEENKKIAKQGGHVAFLAKEELEDKLGEKVISNKSNSKKTF